MKSSFMTGHKSYNSASDGVSAGPAKRGHRPFAKPVSTGRCVGQLYAGGCLSRGAHQSGKVYEPQRAGAWFCWPAAHTVVSRRPPKFGASVDVDDLAATLANPDSVGPDDATVTAGGGRCGGERRDVQGCCVKMTVEDVIR